MSAADTTNVEHIACITIPLFECGWVEIPLFLCAFGEIALSRARGYQKDTTNVDHGVYFFLLFVCTFVDGVREIVSPSLSAPLALSSRREINHSLSPDGGKNALSRARIEETRTWIILCISLYLCSCVCVCVCGVSVYYRPTTTTHC